MKRNLLFLLMAFMTLSFGACNDDDKINDDNQGGNGAITVEWATNERVALEVAWGAAMNGQRAMCTMNHAR